MQKINSNSILTGYIKQLLHSFNLPKAKVLKKGMNIYKDGYYIDEHAIYLCVKNAKFAGDANIDALRRIEDYCFGKKYPNLTKNLKFTGSLYDSYTHEYLGDYLRFYRDFKGINLMSMYNCLSGRVARKVNILSFDSDNTDYVIYLIPVKFNSVYTIGIDCSSSIELMSCLYTKDRPVSIEYNSNLQKATYSKKAGCSISHPFVYDKLKDYPKSILNVGVEDLALQERNLCLLMKIPASNTSSIVVLEGDWTSSSYFVFEDGKQKTVDQICNYERIHYISNLNTPPSAIYKNDIFIYIGDVENNGKQYRYDAEESIYRELNKDETSPYWEYTRKYGFKSQLLLVNDGVSYPFADKLIGYLLENVISGADSISDNIRRVQKALGNRSDVKYGPAPSLGYWETGLRDYVYDLAKKRGVVDSSFDSIGFVDKDVEAILGADVNCDADGHMISGGTR